MRNALWILCWLVTALIGVWSFGWLFIATAFGGDVPVTVVVIAIVSAVAAAALLMNLRKDHWPN